MNGRDLILSRIRAALDGSESPDVLPRSPGSEREKLEADVGLFAQRLADYGVELRSVPGSELSDTLTVLLREVAERNGRHEVLVPADLPGELGPYDITLEGLQEAAGVRFVTDPQSDGSWLDIRQMDRSSGVMTVCAVAITETGTVVLDGGPGQGRRALSLIPDFHICVVPIAALVGGVAEAMEHLHRKHRGAWPPLTLISGPSATSDIELHRIEGVHGPRTLKVVLVE